MEIHCGKNSALLFRYFSLSSFPSVSKRVLSVLHSQPQSQVHQKLCRTLAPVGVWPKSSGVEVQFQSILRMFFFPCLICLFAWLTCLFPRLLTSCAATAFLCFYTDSLLAVERKTAFFCWVKWLFYTYFHQLPWWMTWKGNLQRRQSLCRYALLATKAVIKEDSSFFLRYLFVGSLLKVIAYYRCFNSSSGKMLLCRGHT